MFHSAYIKNDTDMIKDDIRSICRNSNVSEDLGMIEYILSDKTGTLTKNTMKFKEIHIGYTSELENVSLLNFQFLNLNDIQTELENLNAKLLFALVLICCNSVEPLNGKFEGISQDEICIIEALKDNNIVLLEREDMNIKIKIDKVILKIEIKHILDFSSSRQRMSVVVRIFNKNYLFIKGSDQMMIDIKKLNQIKFL
ncbi:phospholipid transporting atpase [Vairimorpha apis BRL 01]|uniref:Phospholipid transporting atpase n=1 Tax=Vairimorpha apis BRL 01 TaxID=1037528 RepID=T0ML29_9MICR|nr:phospholipid transporting atpase [Vairimorpha apis BRL 01]